MRRDRLEALTALINGREFDPVLRGGVLKIPPTHPVYPWSCTVVDCARPRWRRYAMCSVHAEQWQETEARGMNRAQFLRTAEPLPTTEVPEAMMCRICPQRPAFSLQLVLSVLTLREREGIRYSSPVRWARPVSLSADR
jgi:hypothetical protein